MCFETSNKFQINRKFLSDSKNRIGLREKSIHTKGDYYSQTTSVLMIRVDELTLVMSNT